MDLQFLGEFFEEGLGGDGDVGAGDGLPLAVIGSVVILDIDLCPLPGLVEGAEVRFQGGEVISGENAALVFGEIVVDFSGDIGKIFGVRK